MPEFFLCARSHQFLIDAMKKKKIDRIYHILVKTGTTIQYGNFHPQIIVTVNKNLVLRDDNFLAKVTILYCCAVFN